MSITEREEFEPDYCDEHGCEKPCRYCRLDNIDLYSDMQIQDALDRRKS